MDSVNKTKTASGQLAGRNGLGKSMTVNEQPAKTAFEPPDFGGHPMFYKLGEEDDRLYSQKHYQYATDADPMSNFRLCGDLLRKLLKPGVDPTIAAALALMSKQIVGVYEIVGEGKTNTIESLEDKLRDIGIYSRIIRILGRESGLTDEDGNIQNWALSRPDHKVTDGPYCCNCGKLAEFCHDAAGTFWCNSCSLDRHYLLNELSPLEKL